MGLHPSHVTRMSDASSFDEICINCGNTDILNGGWGKLAEPCPNTNPGAWDYPSNKKEKTKMRTYTEGNGGQK